VGTLMMEAIRAGSYGRQAIIGMNQIDECLHAADTRNGRICRG
jgi:hypothetical protein